MRKISINQSTLDNYWEECAFEQDELELIAQMEQTQQDIVALDVEKISTNLLEYILINDANIDLQTKAEITLKYLVKNNPTVQGEEKNSWDTKIRGLDTILKIYETLKKDTYNADYLFFGRKYPVNLVVELVNAARFQNRQINFRISLKIQKVNYNIKFNIESSDIASLRQETKNLSFRELMKRFDIYEQKEDLILHEQKLSETKKLQKQNGKQIICEGLGLSSSFDLINMSSFNQQSSCIVESDLEFDKRNYTNSDFKNYTELPFVRTFSMMHKKYLYVHIDDISEYNYQQQAFQKLFLPPNVKSILEKVFSYSTEHLTGDIINNKHGGLIIMAEGNPGTGKTSTAEVYSELNQKPLYTIQIDEIGTNSTAIEENLTRIFRRVEKWGAIILFDEVDVFLSQRDDNIEKSAIVCVFLRLMDYFRGMMFLTTNRSEIIDNAVLSRVTLNVKYPDFTDEVRALIWESKLKDADLQIDSMENLIKIDLNGRQIRSMVRLGKIVFREKIKEKEFIELISNSVCSQNMSPRAVR